MCKWGDCVNILVPIPANLSYTGDFRWDYKLIDRCIADLVQKLNSHGIFTAACCCGHGKANGSIILHDGTELIINRTEFFDV